MRKILTILITLFLISSEIYATGVSPAILGAAASSSAAAARRRREEEERQHQLQYHNGPMTCYVEKYEVWSWKKPYIISFYEKECYYYQKDPNRCVQSVKENFRGRRFATEQETYKHDLHIRYMIIIVTVLLTAFAGVIATDCIYDKVKKKKEKGNKNITHLED